MTLTTEEAKLYYKRWLPLLDYVNKKYGINENLKQMAGAEGMNPDDVKKVADKLWEDVAVIDEYLAEHADEISEENRTIVESWKRKICVGASSEKGFCFYIHGGWKGLSGQRN